jgi:hypothetical protein
MALQSSNNRRVAVSAEQLRSILGDIDDAKFIEILEMRPTLAEVEQAAIWATGDGDILAKEGRPLSGKAAQIVEILTADEEEPPPVR